MTQQPQPQRPVRSLSGDDIRRISNLIDALNAIAKAPLSYSYIDIQKGNLMVFGTLYLKDRNGLVKKIEPDCEGFALIEPDEWDHENWFKDPEKK